MNQKMIKEIKETISTLFHALMDLEKEKDPQKIALLAFSLGSGYMGLKMIFDTHPELERIVLDVIGISFNSFEKRMFDLINKD